jgi:uncharacterized membrane protein HdeD (DUF308 family)
VRPTSASAPWPPGTTRPTFTGAERAALALAESVTRIADRSEAEPDEIWAEASRHDDEQGLAALLIAVSAVNVRNRLNVATRQVAGAWKGSSFAASRDDHGCICSTIPGSVAAASSAAAGGTAWRRRWAGAPRRSGSCPAHFDDRRTPRSASRTAPDALGPAPPALRESLREVPMFEVMTKYWWAVTLRGALAVVFGLMALVWPGVTVLVLVALFGAYALVDGAIAIWQAVGPDAATTGRRWWLALEGVIGVLAGIGTFLWPGITALTLLLLGLVLVIRPGAGVLAVTWLIGAYAVVFGLSLVTLGLRLRRLRHDSRSLADAV